MKAFAKQLQGLQAASGTPSTRDLERLFRKIGKPSSRSTINELLNGRRLPPWAFVETFVRACALYRGDNHPDLAFWRARHAQMLQDHVAVPPRRIRTQECPYRGLQMFTAEDADWFYGREAAVDAVLAGLDAHSRALLVLGPSGAGKSSLVRAGVLPALALGAISGSDRWQTVVTRPGQDLLADIRGDRLAIVPDSGDGSLKWAIENRLDDQPPGTRLLLVIDQFEELLTPSTTDDAPSAAIDQLAALIGKPQLTIMLVMRDDFYPRLAAHGAGLLELLKPGFVNIPATLGEQELRDIIVKPAALAGLRFDDNLPERIIGDVLAVDRTTTTTRTAPVTVLPLLELTLQLLWTRRTGSVMTHDGYRRIGAVAGAVTRWCDAVIDELTPAQQQTAQRILTALVRPADEERRIPAVRQQLPIATLHELAAPGSGRSDGDNSADGHARDDVLDVLAANRIVSTRNAGVPGEGGQYSPPVAELVHDALIHNWATLRNWISADHRFQEWLYRARTQLNRWKVRHDPDDLLHGTDLAEGLDWSERRSLTHEVASYVGASRRHQQNRTRRLWASIFALLTAFAVSLAATAYAIESAKRADQQHGLALSRQLAAQSELARGAKRSISARLAAAALHVARTNEALNAAGSLLTNYRSMLPHSSSVSAVAFSPDGKVLASASASDVRLWDPATGRPFGIPLTGHAGSVTDVAFSPDGKLLAVTSGDDFAGVSGEVRLWDPAVGRPVGAPLTGRTGSVHAAAFSPDSRLLAVASGDSLASGSGEVRLWDPATGQPIGALPADDMGSVEAVMFSPDGKLLATISRGEVRLWDPATGRPASVQLAGYTDLVTAWAFSPDSKLLAIASASPGDSMGGEMQLWDLATGHPVGMQLTDDPSSAQAVAFSPDNKLLVTASGSEVRLRDPTTGHTTGVPLTGHTGSVTDVAFSPDGKLLAVALASTDFPDQGGEVRLWDPGTRRLVGAPLTGHTGSVEAVAFSPDGTLIASAGDFPTPSANLGGELRLWDTTTGYPASVPVTDIPGTVTDLAFSPDGKLLASASANVTDGQVLLWDKATGLSVGGPLADDTGPVHAVAFSPDGKLLACASESELRLWDPATRRPVGPPLIGYRGSVTDMAFSPNGKLLATASEREVRLWNLTTHRPVGWALTGHTGPVHAVAFSPNGKVLASASEHEVRLWNSTTHGPVGGALTGHTGSVHAVAFSPDGKLLASASGDANGGQVRLWDPTTGHPVGVPITGFPRAVQVVAFSPSSKVLASATGDDNGGEVWLSDPTTYQDPLKAICSQVGEMSEQEWSVYAPDERRESVCG
ncbi:hypothetical protein Rhe02_95960 [Rhizocola hellebori]|uniref:Novel STAND NTPase 1 domain-containing protein n=2 Tax=Rhizocola hellebori TaxID=1392758 RepID=A0A8J3VLL1_9ACTN|nr:hypothetical protein Rhe02_95960 [Rhizocola hellebori]